ncbi:Endonuclease/Exonuclease/phosphatase family protein [Streptomyces sp. ADI95-16]|uniref:RNA repair domain-containing protein n=1 Tax=Streptomyces sp. ADI95-16 TaxID=1522758 RepID=UPI000F3AA4B1|nr:RNA repair domain-containing protein [Streptomyces sp. ADI95-16]AYV26139.1 Endonuclease/Exonuclease/phosphatase family protein [Streptomyces sp. ADI95-16]
MRTSEELYHQVRWDPRFDPSRFVFGLLQRGAAPKRVPLPSFVPGGDIPWHRVLFAEADGELVWDRATGLDLVDTTRAGRVRAARLLRSPFFTARTPYAWDPAGGGAWRPSEPGPAARPPARIRVLTWNTLWDRYDAPRISTARRRPLLLAELARADADVIALQEVEPALLDLLLAAPWVRAGYTLGTDPGGRDVADSGLLLLSRLPVREAGLHVLRRHKGVAAVTVDGAAGPLVVAATHLTSDHTEGGAGRRDAELAAIAEGFGGVEADLALVGDFNDGRGGAEGPAAALGMRDAWSDVHGAADGTPTFDPAANPLAAVGSLTGRSARLDRILLRPGPGPGAVRVREASLRGDSPSPDGLFISDHYGVEAVLESGAPGEGPAPLDVPATARTAVAWLPPHDPAVEELRREHDPQAGRWPAHVNLLFGFVPESSFGAAVPLLAEVAARTQAFTVRMAGVHDFGHREGATLWLDPAADGDGPWQELRRALVERFPGCRGRREGYTPHLTLGHSRDPRRAVREFTARLGGAAAPAPARVGALAVLSRRGDGPMRVRATVELGTGEVRWIPEPQAGPAPTGAAQAHAESVRARVARALDDGVVHLAGSRRMGCAGPDADLDLVAALPGTVGGAEVRERIAAALPEAERLREVKGARVPGLRFRVAGLDVDLVVVATGGLDPARALARRAELGEAAALALSAVSDADAVRESVGAEHAAFARLAREVKAWARARGLDSAPFGGLPGIAWAVLAARTVREAAGPPPDSLSLVAPSPDGLSPDGLSLVALSPDALSLGAPSPDGLLREFFGAWAAWDWREPVALYDPPSAPGSEGAVTVLTPSEPVRSCTAQVGPGLRDLLGRELYEAWESPQAGPPSPHRRHAAWAVVTVRGATPQEFEESLGRTRGRLRALLGALEEGGVAEAHAWPRPFERGDTVARYAIGLGAEPPDAARLAALCAPWATALVGVEVAWAECGEVPALP